MHEEGEFWDPLMIKYNTAGGQIDRFNKGNSSVFPWTHPCSFGPCKLRLWCKSKDMPPMFSQFLGCPEPHRHLCSLLHSNLPSGPSLPWHKRTRHSSGSVGDVDYDTNARCPEVLCVLWRFVLLCSAHFCVQLGFVQLQGASKNSFLEILSSTLRSGGRLGSPPIVSAWSELQNMECETSYFKVRPAETRASLFRTRSTTTLGTCHIHQP